MKLFGNLNDKLIMNSKKPLATINARVTKPLKYQDAYIYLEKNPGDILEAKIYIDGDNELIFGEYPDPGGYVTVSSYLENYIDSLDFMGIKRVNLTRISTRQQHDMLASLSSKYNIDFIRAIQR